MSNIFEKLGDTDKGNKNNNDNNDEGAGNDADTHLTKKELRAQDKQLRETYGDVVEKDAPKRQEDPVKPKDDWASGEKRPFDRHSANANPNSGAPRDAKKQGHGKGNVGNIKEQIEEGLAGDNNDDDYEEAQGDDQNADNDTTQATVKDNTAGNEQGQEGQNQQNKEAGNDIITVDQYVKNTGIDYAFLHNKKEGHDEHTGHTGQVNDPNLKAHVQKAKDHPEYHKKARDPDAIFTPSTNIADPNVPDEPEKKDDDNNKQENVNENQIKKELDQAAGQTGDNQNADQQQNQNANKTDNNDKNNQNNQAQVATDANKDKADDKKAGNDEHDTNITAINAKDDSVGSANDQNKTVNDIISELDQDKKADKQTADANLASKDAKPLDQTLTNATDTTLNRGFIEESINQGDASNLPPIEKQTSPTPSTITQHGSVNEKNDQNLHQAGLTNDNDQKNNNQQNDANKKYDEQQDALEKLTTQSEPNLLTNDLKQGDNATTLGKTDSIGNDVDMKKKDNDDVTDSYKA